jgi:hypothetical protein
VSTVDKIFLALDGRFLQSQLLRVKTEFS